MKPQLLDLSFLRDIADNDTNYIYDVMKLFLDSVPTGLAKLEKLVREANDFEAIQRQAHSLKSSAGIVKIRGMYENLAGIESLARQKSGIEEMIVKLEDMLVNFKEALPLLLEEKEKNKPVAQ